MGTLMFFLYLFIVFFCLLTMFVTIINEAFAAVSDDIAKQSNDFEMVDFIVDQFKRWIGKATLQRRMGVNKAQTKTTSVDNLMVCSLYTKGVIFSTHLSPGMLTYPLHGCCCDVHSPYTEMCGYFGSIS